MSEIARIEQIRDPVARTHALSDYIARAEAARSNGVALRRAAIRDVLKDHGPSETAKLCRVSLSLVKAAKS